MHWLLTNYLVAGVSPAAQFAGHAGELVAFVRLETRCDMRLITLSRIIIFTQDISMGRARLERGSRSNYVKPKQIEKGA